MSEDRPAHGATHADQARAERDVADRVRAWAASLPSATTSTAYHADVRTFRNWIESTGRTLMEASSSDVRDFRAHSEREGAAPATVRRRLAAISSFYRHAGGTVDQPADPTRGARRPRADVVSGTAHLSPAEADAVWQAARDLGPKTTTVVGMILLHGFKSNELLALDVDDVRGVGRAMTATVDRGGTTEVVDVDPRLATFVRRYIARRRSGPLLLGDNPTRETARLTRYGVDYLVKRSGAAAGLTVPLTVNVLRRTYALAARREGMTLDDLRQVLGHADVRSTLRYVERSPPG